MFSTSTVLIALVSLAAGFAIRDDVTGRTKRDAPYRGPPAPLNHDGTVAFTSEFQHANDIHNAAYAEEYQRLRSAAALAAAHPDRTSPPSKDYNPQENGQYNHQQYDGQHASQQEDDGQYRPHLYENEQSNQQYTAPVYVSQPQVAYKQEPTQQYYNPGTYNAGHYNPSTQHNQQLFSPAPYHTQSFIPAPLNPDGTVAHTPEYKALAATLHSTYQQALTRHRRSLSHYHGPPAPLNHDGTVANTPEVEHAIAVHKAAYAQEYQKVKDESFGGYGHQPYSSHNEDDGQYKPHLYEHEDYNPHQEEEDHYDHLEHSSSHYKPEPYKYNPEAHIPAPLNHDGTVAHTAEYKAIAAAHQAEFEKTLHSVRHQSIPHHDSVSHNYW